MTQRSSRTTRTSCSPTVEPGAVKRLLLVELASALAGGGPLAMVVAGGGEVTRTEVTEASRHGWPIFVLTGTGGAADELAALWRRHRERRVRRLASALPERFRYRSQPPVSEIADPALRDVVARGDVRVAAEGEPAALANRLAWELHGDETLKAAWQKFATYDQLANGLRRSFERFQAAILIAGILATLLALIQSAIKSPVLHWVVIALPIAGSVLIAIANRRSAGKRWVMLRGAAESLKSEIYRYRARSSPYQVGANRAGTLATRVDWVVAALIRTEASSGPLTPYTGPLPPKMYGAASDDGITPLDPDRYLKTRVAAQLDYYHGQHAGRSTTQPAAADRDLSRRRGGRFSPRPGWRSGSGRPRRSPSPGSRSSVRCRSIARSSPTTRPPVGSKHCATGGQTRSARTLEPGLRSDASSTKPRRCSQPSSGVGWSR